MRAAASRELPCDTLLRYSAPANRASESPSDTEAQHSEVILFTEIEVQPGRENHPLHFEVVLETNTRHEPRLIGMFQTLSSWGDQAGRGPNVSKRW